MQSHQGSTATKLGAAASKTAQNKIDKYAKLVSKALTSSTRFFMETAGTWHDMAVKLTQEIGRRVTALSDDTRETTFLFQCLSIGYLYTQRKCSLVL